MVTKKMSRFFGLLSERSHPESPAPEHSIAGHPAFDPAPAPAATPAPAAAATQPPAGQENSAGPLLRALDLNSHADDMRLTEQEKRMAWELPPRTTVPDAALVPRSTSKARLMLPALEQMRQTQATLMAGYTSAIEDEIESAKVPEPSPESPHSKGANSTMKQPHAAQPKQTPAPESVQAPRVPMPPQPTTTASSGWEYTVMLQRTEDPAPPSAPERAPERAAASDATGISQMFQRLRSHSATPPTPPAADAKAPGFLHKLWAK